MTVWNPIPVPGMPKHYMAGSDGRILKCEYDRVIVTKRGTETRTFKERILKWRMGKPSFKGVKHPVVTIYKGSSREDNRGEETRVAYLVCAAFYGIPWSTPAERMKWRIRFKDGNHLNCWATNLEWVHVVGESGGEAQERYNRNKDGWDKRKQETPAEFAARMGYDEEAA